MKILRVINGRRYNTETATRVADYSSGGYYPGDFNFHDTAIFRTAKGAWFVAGSGGALSRWNHSIGNNGYGGGSGIEPLTERQALEELEQIGTSQAIDAINQYFADQVQDA